MEFAGSPDAFLSIFPAYGNGLDSYWVLRVKAWWVASILVGYMALPAIVMSLLPGKRLRDCHLSWRGFAQHYWLYVGLYGAVLPVIWHNASISTSASSRRSGYDAKFASAREPVLRAIEESW